MTKARILVVEDDGLIAAYIRASLQRLGHDVVGMADTGEKALSLAQALYPDLALMDIGLAGALDGITIAERLRANTPVVFLTAHTDPATLDRAKRAEPFGYLTKPFQESTLQATVEMALYKHQLERRLRESEALLRGFINRTSDALVLIDEEGALREWNPGAETLTGLPREAVLGRPFWEVHEALTPPERRSPERFACLKTQMQAALQTGTGSFIGRPVEAVFQHMDGSHRAVTEFIFTIPTERGYWLGGAGRDDTQRRQAEAALRESELNFRAFFNTIDHLLFVVDEQGRILLTNETARRRLGYPDSDLIGRNVVQFHPPERQAEAGRVLAEILAGQSDACAIPLMTRDGRLMPVETRAFRGHWSGQAVIFGVSKDLSQLQASEEKFAKAFQANAALMAISDLDTGCYVEVNDTFLQTLGYAREEVVGRTTTELKIFADPARRAAALQLLSQQGYLRNYEVAVRAKSGAVHHGLFAAEILPLQDRRLLLTVMADITERKRAEQEREWYLIQLGQRVKEQGLLYRVSRLLHNDVRPVAEVLQAVVDLLPEGWPAPETTAARLTLAGAEWRTARFAPSPYCQSAVWITSAGEHGALEVVNLEAPEGQAGFPPEAHTLLGALAEMLSGFIERRAALDQIRQLNIQLEERVADRTAALTRALRAKDEFLAAMSHELRTPLNGMLGLAEVLAGEVYGPVSTRQSEALHNILASGQHLLGLINTLLDYAQLESGQLMLSREPVMAAAAGRASLKAAAAAAEAKGLKLVFDCAEPEAWLVTDEQRLRQILGYVVDNAVKFTPAGGQVRLTVRAERERGLILWQVQDNGLGIPSAEQARIFQPFVQLDARLARAYEGAGLGLALARRLALLLGGDISVASPGVPGQGSCFTLSLPGQ